MLLCSRTRRRKDFNGDSTGCIVHIKIAGDADFTNWTFNLNGKGGPGGAGGAAVAGGAGGNNGNDGVDGTAPTLFTVPYCYRRR